VQIALEQLIAVIVREVVAELRRRGVEVAGPALPAPASGPPQPAVRAAAAGAPVPPAAAGSLLSAGPAAGDRAVIDMSAYRTPVLTEEHLTRLGPSVRTVVIPCSTVLTPGARDQIRMKKLSVVRHAQSH
jgi:hypothetical protein